MDGNEVSSENWADALVLGAVKATVEQYTQRATKNVSTMICPTHGVSRFFRGFALTVQAKPNEKMAAILDSIQMATGVLKMNSQGANPI